MADLNTIILESEQKALASRTPRPHIAGANAPDTERAGRADAVGEGRTYRVQVGEQVFRISAKTLEKAPRESRLREAVEALGRFVSGMVAELLESTPSAERSGVLSRDLSGVLDKHDAIICISSLSGLCAALASQKHSNPSWSRDMIMRG
jgi:hypothetical protein